MKCREAHLGPKSVTQLSPPLGDLYGEVIHVAAVGLDRADDQDVWEYAKTHNYTLATKDEDFRDRSNLYGSPPKVIRVRTGNCTTSDILALFTSNVDVVKSFVADSEASLLVLDRTTAMWL